MITFLYGRRSARLWACGAVATVSFALFLHLLPTWGVALSGRQEKLGTLSSKRHVLCVTILCFVLPTAGHPICRIFFICRPFSPTCPAACQHWHRFRLSVGWQTWVSMFLFVFFWALWKRDRAALLVAQPCLWAVAVLWVASANGEFRYVLPILWNLPLFAALIFSKRTA